MIIIEDLNNQISSLQAIERAILQLPKTALFASTEDLFIANTLAVFNFPPGKIIAEDRATIENGCKEILQQTGMLEIEPNDLRTASRPEHEYEPIFQYRMKLLRFTQLPYKVKENLDFKVRSDLTQIVKLIKSYEKEKAIQEYLKGNAKKDHETRTIIDFYKRCLREKDAIVDYLIEGIYDHALQKAKSGKVLDGNKYAYLDYPYQWAIPGSIAYYDYTKISNCTHRIWSGIDNDEFQALVEGYEQGKKREFYESILSINPASNIFRTINEYFIRLLPQLNKRADIFSELETLYMNKNWIGFSALALLQVEGLFTDMVRISSPEKEYMSLSDKVNAIRSVYKFSQRDFDYYEYVLPRIRNSFMHTGNLNGQDYWVLAHEMLYDNLHLLYVFGQLEDPAILLTIIIKRQDVGFLAGLTDIVEFLQMVQRIDDKWKKTPKSIELSETWQLWVDFTTNGAWGIYWRDLFTMWVTDTNDQLFPIFDMLNFNFSLKQIDLNFFSTPIKEIYRQKDKIMEEIFAQDLGIKLGLTEVFQSLQLLSGYKKLFPNLPNEIEQDIIAINTYHEKTLKILTILSKSFTISGV